VLLKDFIKTSCESLERIYPAAEARSIVSILCEERLGVESYDHILNPSLAIPNEQEKDLKADLERLLENEPLQYVLGYTWFRGHKFTVSPSVLIPRPETEELVEYALKGFVQGAKVLDLCTGSGCIAWSVALERPDAKVTAVDISKDALELARSQNSGAEIEFLEADVLKDNWYRGLGQFDLILSNPPYIKQSERALMNHNVLDFEPELALFVQDSDPLVFYKAIANICTSLLSNSGRGIVEINETLGPETAAIFESASFKKVEIIKDLRGKDRFISFLKR